MSKLRSTLSTCCLLFCLILEIHSDSEFKPFTLTKQWTANTTYPPNAVRINGIEDDLLVVGLENNTIYVNSTFNGNQSDSCKLDFLKPDEIAGHKIRVYALGNGQIIINTPMMTESHKLRSKGPSRPVWRMLLIFYPFQCSNLKKVELRRNDRDDFEALVPYHDTFDVFYHSESTDNADDLKSPQRYNNNGEQLNLNYSIGLENQFLIRNIQTLIPNDASEGYISYIDTGTENVLRLLNPHFETLAEATVDNFISTVSGKFNGKINYCYSTTKPYNNSKNTKEEGSEHVVCKFLATGLKTQDTQELPKPVERKRVYNTILTNLFNGGVVATVAYRYPRKTDGFPMRIFAHYTDRLGVTRKPVEIFSHSIYYQDVAETISLDNGDVCFVNGGEMEPYKPFQSVRNSIWIDCYKVSD